jgi:transcriptional antiterminator/mannitol/fructose-specific phosphotransferase system IIA component (Ntr-type)
MMIEKRPALLLDYLLKVRNTTMNQIMAATQLTKRQISYDLEKVNQWLKESGLSTIQYKGSHYIVLPEDVVQHFQEEETNQRERDFVLTEEERLAVIYLYLFIRHESISSNHLIQLLQVSKNTVMSDLKKANKQYRSYLVEIQYSRQRGYHLKGTEFDKRVLAMHCLSSLRKIPYFQNLIHYLLKTEKEDTHYEEFLYSLKQIEKEFELNFVEERLHQFALFLTFYYYRQREKKFVEFYDDEIKLIQREPMSHAARRLSQLLQLENEESEICYLTIQLLGLSFGSYSFQDSEQNILFKLTKQLVLDFESKTCIVFEKEDEVVKRLYQHIKPAYFRMKYRIPAANSLLNEIKSEHSELYAIAQEILHPIGSLLGINIPEDEIGFIAIYFGALLEQKTNREVPKRKKALVVCPSGISSSLMVKHQLESLFSEIAVENTLSLREFQEGHFDHYDLIFSTVRLETKLPCFYVKPIMTPNEKNQLVNEVYQFLFGIQYQDISLNELVHIIGKYADIYDEGGLKHALGQLTFHKRVFVDKGNHPVLQDMLQAKTIQMMEGISDWEEAVKTAAYPLLENGSIEPAYIDAMIANIKALGPYVVIGPETAIPHARPEQGVNKAGMSLLKLDTPVNFLQDEKYPVRLVFCIAAPDNKTHLKALAQLTKMLNEKNNLGQLIEANSIEEITALVQQYSTSE